MKPRAKQIITILFVLFILLCLRESGIINLNLYSSKSKTDLNYTWKDNTVTVSIDSSTFTTKFVSDLYSKVPVIVLYKGDTIYNELRGRDPITVRIEYFHIGLGAWIPIYKATEFSAVGTAKYYGRLVKIGNGKMNFLNPHLSAKLAINGSISILGFTSRYFARKLMFDIVVNNFVQETKKHFADLD